MTLKHKLKLIPARFRWFLKDIKGVITYYRKFKTLKSFVARLEEEYLEASRQSDPDDKRVTEKKSKYEVAKIILKGNYHGS